ncbi:MAG: 3-phosphoshikimate 1-carboxyvinyltransferase [Ginsengibacter sp.]
MIVSISPSKISGSIHAPSSKSSMQRACAVALISGGTTIIENAGKSNDEEAAQDIIGKLGARLDYKRNQIIVTSSKKIFTSTDKNKHTTLSCGESGLSLRMFVPLAALYNYEITFTGVGSILRRPIDFFDKVLPQLGVSVHSNDGLLPITLKGPLKPTNITIDGSLSSQFLTGLLIAYSKACTAPVSIKVNSLASKPYIDLTLNILNQFGFRIENENYEKFTVFPRDNDINNTIKYKVEGDWSNTAFLLVAGAIAGGVTVKGADLNSTQGDKKIVDALEAIGAVVKFDGDALHVKNKELSAFNFDATHAPDLFPPLVALAAFCKGNSTIKGVNRLLHKESNRALTLKKEFAKMSVTIDLDDDVMVVHGGKQVHGAKVTSHNDHRIAMACAVAALGANGQTTIHEADAVNKSYPGFFDDIKLVGASLQLS